MRVELLTDDHPAWVDTLTRTAHDFYHLPAYARLEARRTQAVPQAFLATEGDKLFFLPYLLRSCTSLFGDRVSTDSTLDAISPYGYPGILLSEPAREPDFARRAVEALCQTLASSGVCSGFFRMHPLLNADVRTLFPEDLFTDNGDTVAIDLRQDEATIWQGIREGHQATINKCRKAGFTARMVPLLDHFDEFLETYRQTMDRVKAKTSYYFDRDYFLAMAQMPEHVSCCLAEREGQVAAACIFLDCGGITQAHLGGTKTAFLSNSPFHLVLHHAALSAKARGSRFLHLGGGLGGANDMLLRFKAGFAPPQYRFHTLRLITNDDRYRQLVDLRAHAIHVSPESLRASSFFPAYRAEPACEGS